MENNRFDDDSWWHAQDELLQQELEEQDRINRFNKAMAELNSIINEELNKITRGLH